MAKRTQQTNREGWEGVCKAIPAKGRQIAVALYRRNGNYHCDRSLNGQRYRQTLETTDWREAKQKENDLIALAKQGKLASGRLASLARLTIGDGFDRHFEER